MAKTIYNSYHASQRKLRLLLMELMSNGFIALIIQGILNAEVLIYSF